MKPPHPVCSRSPVLVVTGGNHFDLLVRFPRLPRANDRLAAHEALLAPGGMGGNVATAFARLGGQARFAGSFTDDDDGNALLRDMQMEGIDTTWADVRPTSILRRGFIVVGEHGERAILNLPPQTMTLPRSWSRTSLPAIAPSPADRKSEFFHGLRERPLPQAAFHAPVDGFYCPSAFASALIPQLPADLSLFIDIETGHLNGLEQGEIVAILQRASLVFGNQENLQPMPRHLGAQNLADLACSVGTTIIETRGAEGCVVYADRRTFEVPGFAVNTVDTTGAGDCFAGAFIFATLRGMTIPSAAGFANAAAALSTCALGSRGGAPRVLDVERFLAGHVTEAANSEGASDSVMSHVSPPSL